MSNYIVCSCIICKAVISTSHLARHYKSKPCLRGGKTNFIKKYVEVITECPFCDIPATNQNSIVQHMIRCSKNPDKLVSDYAFGGDKYQPTSWNKGLTKETDERVKSSGITLSTNFKNGLLNRKSYRYRSPEVLAKLSQLAKERGLGGVRNSRKIDYNGVKLGSSYEVTVAMSLDENHIKWIKPKRMKYTDINGKARTYEADFYLPEFDVYLDPKNDFLIENVNPALGFKDCDKIKWASEQNNVTILILNKSQLSWDYIKTMLP